MWRTTGELVSATINEWFEDKAERLGASLAYYAAFSLSPLLILVVAIVDFVYQGESTTHIRAQIAQFIGPEAADVVVATIRSVNQSDSGTLATIISVIVLFIGATAVFTELQDAMNTIWEVTPRPRQFLSESLRLRVLSFAMVLGVCFLLLVSMMLSAFLSALSSRFRGLLPGTDFVWGFADVFISFAVVTLLFALIFKVLPDVLLAWRDVWLGAVVTAVLFTVGKSLIALYLGRSAIGSAYGVAGSVLVVMAWVYYSSQILFLGAEFTQVYANRYGSRVRPARGAIPLSEMARLHQGIPHHETIERAMRKPDAA
jgi:membrane protein